MSESNKILSVDYTHHTSCSCPLCIPGKIYQSPYHYETPPSNIPYSQPLGAQYGWVCPLCNCVYAPTVSECGKNHQIYGNSITVTNGSATVTLDNPTNIESSKGEK